MHQNWCFCPIFPKNLVGKKFAPLARSLAKVTLFCKIFTSAKSPSTLDASYTTRMNFKVREKLVWNNFSELSSLLFEIVMWCVKSVYIKVCLVISKPTLAIHPKSKLTRRFGNLCLHFNLKYLIQFFIKSGNQEHF